MTMRRKRFSVAFILISSMFLTFLFSGYCLSAEKGPKIQFEELKWDFGRKKQGDVLTHTFLFENVGDEPLVIERVRTSCGCAAASPSKKKFNPGEKGEIEVSFNTRGYYGEQNKFIYVDSNDPSESVKQLMISASVDVPPSPKIELDSYTTDLGLVLEGEELRTEFNIRNKGVLELTVTPFHADASFFIQGKKISPPLKIAAGKTQRVEVRIPPRNRMGLVREFIRLQSNDPMRSTLSLYLVAYNVSRQQLKELFDKYREVLD
jgi:hypothetical protein